jgi:hypothetical protein
VSGDNIRLPPPLRGAAVRATLSAVARKGPGPVAALQKCTGGPTFPPGIDWSHCRLAGGLDQRGISRPPVSRGDRVRGAGELAIGGIERPGNLRR